MVKIQLWSYQELSVLDNARPETEESSDAVSVQLWPGLGSYWPTCPVLQCKILEQRLEQGMVFTEYERILKKRLVDGECSTAQLPENAERNRFQDVLPYDNARVELVPTKENNTGYINASHIKVRGTARVSGT